jgi:hypothetical protein
LGGTALEVLFSVSTIGRTELGGTALFLIGHTRLSYLNIPKIFWDHSKILFATMFVVVLAYPGGYLWSDLYDL